MATCSAYSNPQFILHFSNTRCSTIADVVIADITIAEPLIAGTIIIISIIYLSIFDNVLTDVTTV